MSRGRNPVATRCDVLEAAKRLDEPVFSSHDVAAELPIGVERTRHLLNDLIEEEVLTRKSVGNGYAYYFP